MNWWGWVPFWRGVPERGEWAGASRASLDSSRHSCRLAVRVPPLFLLVSCLLMTIGCQKKEDESRLAHIIFSSKPSHYYEMSDRGDGWIYFSDSFENKDWIRFRIKDKPTTWEDFDVEDLWKTKPLYHEQ